jgi:DNA-binding GntR family transcriptional regulator
MPTNTEPKSSTTLVDALLPKIRAGIQSGRYLPGQRLVELDLTRELKVSRGVLREAMRRLAGEGMIILEPRRGCIVRRFSMQDVRELHQVREIIEGFAARLAAGNIGSGDNRERLKNLMSDMLKLRKADDAGRYMGANVAFHDLIVEMSGNRHLAGLITQLRLPTIRTQYQRFLDREVKRHSIDDHRAIAKAIFAGNGALAEKTMRRHIRHSAELAEAVAQPVDIERH